VDLLDRPNPTFPFTRLVELISRGKATRDELERMRDMAGLAQNWRRRAAEMLARYMID
jgi:MOSC domain-containing protein YiiM